MANDFIAGLPAPGPRLAAELGRSQLERGFRVPASYLPARLALPSSSGAGPIRRAEPEGTSGSAVSWIGALALLALAGAAAQRLARR